MAALHADMDSPEDDSQAKELALKFVPKPRLALSPPPALGGLSPSPLADAQAGAHAAMPSARADSSAAAVASSAATGAGAPLRQAPAEPSAKTLALEDGAVDAATEAAGEASHRVPTEAIEAAAF